MLSTKDVIAAVAEGTGLSKKDADAAVKKVFDYLSEQMANGEKVSITGFGSFEPKEKAAHQSRNPRTGEMVDVPVSTSVKFKMGAVLKKTVSKQ